MSSRSDYKIEGLTARYRRAKIIENVTGFEICVTCF